MKMKLKPTLPNLIVILAVIALVAVYFLSNVKDLDVKGLDEAIRDSNVPIDEIFHTTEHKGYVIIFYGKDDTLSAGLIEKTRFGYRWGFGAGSRMFNREDRILTRMFSNLHPRVMKSDDERVPLTFGVIYDNSIEELKIKYKDQDSVEAAVIETSKGRIWYAFSDHPVNYDPDVVRVYQDGTEVSGWY